MVKNLSTQEFKDLVHDFDKEEEWKFKGKKPAIIKFGAEWCPPCRTVAPVLEELSEEYKDKIDIYDVDVDEAPEISVSLNVRNIPAIFFIPLNEKPKMTVGSEPKHVFKKTISEVLKIK